MFEEIADAVDAEPAARKAIASYADRHGLTIISISVGWFDWRIWIGQGVSNLARAYVVVARSHFGATRKYRFAYDPAGFSIGQNNGLKRWAGWVWIDAA